MAIGNLLAAAMKESPTPYLHKNVDVEWPINLPSLVANSHVHAYGDDSCSDEPCRLAGLRLALNELLQHRAESRLEAELRAIQATEVARKRICEYVAALDALVASSVEKHRAEKDAEQRGHDTTTSWFACAPSRSPRSCEMDSKRCGPSRMILRELFWSPELYQRFDKHHRAQFALRGAMQALKWTGDLPYREIGQLMISGKASAEIKSAKPMRSSDRRVVQ